MKERSMSFSIRSIGTSGFKEELFKKYPVLWRCIEEKIHQAVGYYVEIVENFVDNKIEIQKKFLYRSFYKKDYEYKIGVV